MPEGLSEKQQQILEFLETFIAEHDYPPSIRDIQNGCNISSTSVVDYNLKRLEEKGLIRRDRPEVVERLGLQVERGRTAEAEGRERRDRDGARGRSGARRPRGCRWYGHAVRYE